MLSISQEADMQSSLQLVDTDEEMTAVIHLIVPRDQIEMVMGPAIHEVIAVLARQKVTPCGPLFSWHRRRPSDTFDFEVGFPVTEPITPDGRVVMSRLPAARVARRLYQGDYAGLGAGWGALIGDVTKAGLSIQWNFWERYLSGPESDPDPANWRTELNLALQR
ncbi:GyrI-like domain-containing protein [Mariprofundus erugo]|nr:GyrI-like domain-containing protein [Mariprofundus erugo]